MKIKILPTEIYDNTAPKETGTIFTAIAGLVFFTLLKTDTDATMIVDILIVSFQFVTAVWVYNIMDRLNRDKGWSAFAAFAFPFIVLFIVGLLKKKHIRFEIDTSYTEEVQLKELRGYAAEFIKKEKFTEAAFVYKYILAKLPYAERDELLYDDLVSKSKIPVPDFKIG